MKYLILILFVLVITGCSKTVISKEHHPYVGSRGWCYEIISIELRDDKLAKYTLSTNTGWSTFINKLYYVDSAGKYRVGQKVLITLEIVSE